MLLWKVQISFSRKKEKRKIILPMLNEIVLKAIVCRLCTKLV